MKGNKKVAPGADADHDKENFVNTPSVTSNKTAKRSKGKNQGIQHLSLQEIEQNLVESALKAVTTNDLPREGVRQSKRRKSSTPEKKVVQDLSTLELLANQAAKIAEKEPTSSQSKGKRSRKNSMVEQNNEETWEDFENPSISPVRRRQKIKRKRFSICIDESVTPEVR